MHLIIKFSNLYQEFKIANKSGKILILKSRIMRFFKDVEQYKMGLDLVHGRSGLKCSSSLQSCIFFSKKKDKR